MGDAKDNRLGTLPPEIMAIVTDGMDQMTLAVLWMTGNKDLQRRMQNGGIGEVVALVWRTWLGDSFLPELFSGLNAKRLFLQRVIERQPINLSALELLPKSVASLIIPGTVSCDHSQKFDFSAIVPNLLYLELGAFADGLEDLMVHLPTTLTSLKASYQRSTQRILFPTSLVRLNIQLPRFHTSDIDQRPAYYNYYKAVWGTNGPAARDLESHAYHRADPLPREILCAMTHLEDLSINMFLNFKDIPRTVRRLKLQQHFENNDAAPSWHDLPPALTDLSVRFYFNSQARRMTAENVACLPRLIRSLSFANLEAFTPIMAEGLPPRLLKFKINEEFIFGVSNVQQHRATAISVLPSTLLRLVWACNANDFVADSLPTSLVHLETRNDMFIDHTKLPKGLKVLQCCLPPDAPTMLLPQLLTSLSLESTSEGPLDLSTVAWPNSLAWMSLQAISYVAPSSWPPRLDTLILLMQASPALRFNPRQELPPGSVEALRAVVASKSIRHFRTNLLFSDNHIIECFGSAALAASDDAEASVSGESSSSSSVSTSNVPVKNSALKSLSVWHSAEVQPTGEQVLTGKIFQHLPRSLLHLKVGVFQATLDEVEEGLPPGLQTLIVKGISEGRPLPEPHSYPDPALTQPTSRTLNRLPSSITRFGSQQPQTDRTFASGALERRIALCECLSSEVISNEMPGYRIPSVTS